MSHRRAVVTTIFKRIYNHFCCTNQPKIEKQLSRQLSQTECESSKVIQYENTIPFIPPIVGGHVVKVYDGDTITIASKLPYPESPVYRFQVRLSNIDCPEIKGKTDEEKQIAHLAKTEMETWVLHKYVELRNISTEKYGRILAEVYIDNKNMNEHMIEKRLAVRYDGGTKIPPSTSWLSYNNKL